MTLTEFIKQLQVWEKHHGEDTVSVAVTHCLSCSSKVPIRSVGPGFDWTAGHILLLPEHPLERYYTAAQLETRNKQVDEICNRNQ